MSQSKFIMAQKLALVQEKLMSETIDDMSLDGLIRLIFKVCNEQKLCFWFNVYENEVVLNLRDVSHENYELNIRQHGVIESGIDDLKKQVLINAFLITKNNVSLSEDVSSADMDTTQKDEMIIDSDKVTPVPIRKAIEKIQNKGIDVTKEAIKNHVQWNQLSTDLRIKCTNYLNQMEAQE